MNFEEYYPLALRTCKQFGDWRMDLQHAAMGFLTEAGELMTIFKRVEIYGKALDDDMRAHAIEELGDFQWYVPLAMLAVGCRRLPLYDPVTELQNKTIGGLILGLNTLVATSMTSLSDAGHFSKSDCEAIAFMSAELDYGIEELAKRLGTTGDEVRRLNIEKLQKRYPEKYTDHAAEARADKGGLDARNS